MVTELEWRIVPGHEHYECSNTGLIRNKETGFIMKPSLRRDGYLSLMFRKSNKKKNNAIHRVYMLTWIPNPLNKPQVNHKNGIKTDNRVENLEWCTVQENRVHAVSTGLITNTTKGRRSHSKLDEIQVLTIRKCLLDGMECKDLAPYFKVSQSLISAIKRRGGLGIGMKAELTQIIYKEEQRGECYPFANVHFNDKLTIFFENEVIKEVVRRSTADKIGVCSWKLRQKQRWNVPKPREITPELLESDYEVLSFTRNTHHHQMLFASERWHPGFMRAMRIICSHVNITVPDEVKQPVYQNAFMATKAIYEDYVWEYLSPVMHAINNRPELFALATQDSGYHELSQRDTAPREWLQEKIGLPFYPMSPFLLERLFSIFCHNNKIKVTYI